MKRGEVSMEQSQNEGAGVNERSRENPPVSGIVQNDFHMQKSGKDHTVRTRSRPEYSAITAQCEYTRETATAHAPLQHVHRKYEGLSPEDGIPSYPQAKPRAKAFIQVHFSSGPYFHRPPRHLDVKAVHNKRGDWSLKARPTGVIQRLLGAIIPRRRDAGQLPELAGCTATSSPESQPLFPGGIVSKKGQAFPQRHATKTPFLHDHERVFSGKRIGLCIFWGACTIVESLTWSPSTHEHVTSPWTHCYCPVIENHPTVVQGKRSVVIAVHDLGTAQQMARRARRHMPEVQCRAGQGRAGQRPGRDTALTSASPQLPPRGSELQPSMCRGTWSRKRLGRPAAGALAGSSPHMACQPPGHFRLRTSVCFLSNRK
ncbi:hypothetical protein PR048_014692 [Dryococelus australis]|uniref:Uncharacterized protein n=1 Tax=Dryococelus australis TaxID=614101 RepID=A0ABQ9HF37_9NEOP|nr:hypothetical protein PR048_014692 [Dryococelus australis]